MHISLQCLQLVDMVVIWPTYVAVNHTIEYQEWHEMFLRSAPRVQVFMKYNTEPSEHREA